MAKDTDKKCQKRGCKAFRLSNSKYCMAHDPKRAKIRKEEQSRGGKTRTAPKALDEAFELQTIPQVKNMLERIANASLQGKIDLGRARTVGYLASLILTCLKDYDLEKRMEELERKLEEVGNRGGK